MTVTNALSLKQFMLRREVLNLYRDLIRTCRQIPDKSSQREMIDWVKRDFRNNQNVQDEMSIKMLLTMGKQSLRELQGSVAISK